MTEKRASLTARLLFAAAVTFLPLPASADLLTLDLFSGSGDNLITLDTETGLEWLDLTATEAVPYLSVIDGSYNGYTTVHGFRLAGEGEVSELFRNAGAQGFMQSTPSNFAPAQNLLGLLGATIPVESDFGRTLGYHDAGTVVELTYIEFSHNEGIFGLNYSNVPFHYPDLLAGLLNHGAFLVREAQPQVAPVPEPSTLLLLSASFAALGTTRARQLKKRS